MFVRMKALIAFIIMYDKSTLMYKGWLLPAPFHWISLVAPSRVSPSPESGLVNMTRCHLVIWLTRGSGKLAGATQQGGVCAVHLSEQQHQGAQ